jgi:hypothetical protein
MKPPDAIAVKLMGGLGNQLFQYAAGRAASLRCGCPLLLDLAPLEARPEGETVRDYTLDAFLIEATVMDASTRDGWVEYIQPDYCYDPRFAEIGSGTRLNGYFQSELFFASHRRQLREELRLVAPVSSAFADISARIRAAELAVSIHLRRGDYASNPPKLEFHGVCGQDYYAKAIRIVEGLCAARPTYFVFSDDHAMARVMFGDLSSVVFARTPPERPWEDMFLMAQCRDHILANSSFSWWASWFNSSESKTIVAPRRWVSPAAMRNLNTADLYLDGTIII